MLREKIGERVDREETIKSVKEFFVFASEFARFKARNEYPSNYLATSDNDHFILFRETASYKFSIDNFSDNETYFERSVFKIFNKNKSTIEPIMTLFLVPQKCDR